MRSSTSVWYVISSFTAILSRSRSLWTNSSNLRFCFVAEDSMRWYTNFGRLICIFNGILHFFLYNMLFDQSADIGRADSNSLYVVVWSSIAFDLKNSFLCRDLPVLRFSLSIRAEERVRSSQLLYYKQKKAANRRKWKQSRRWAVKSNNLLFDSPSCWYTKLWLFWLYCAQPFAWFIMHFPVLHCIWVRATGLSELPDNFNTILVSFVHD